MFNLFKKSQKITDPVCLMKVSTENAAISYEYKHKRYYFCSEGCCDEFAKNPHKYVD